MARAASVLVVRQAYPDADLMRGCFTVEWECAKWLKQQPDPAAFLVERYPDGEPDRGCVRVPIRELLEMETY